VEGLECCCICIQQRAKCIYRARSNPPPLQQPKQANPTQPHLNQCNLLLLQVAPDDHEVRSRLAELNERYAAAAKAPEPHPDIGDWCATDQLSWGPVGC